MAGKDHDTMRDVLNRLTLKPRMKEAARNAGIHPTTLLGWIRKSAAGEAAAPKFPAPRNTHRDHQPSSRESKYSEVPVSAVDHRPATRAADLHCLCRSLVRSRSQETSTPTARAKARPKRRAAAYHSPQEQGTPNLHSAAQSAISFRTQAAVWGRAGDNKTILRQLLGA
jgi:hypothetical protein